MRIFAILSVILCVLFPLSAFAHEPHIYKEYAKFVFVDSLNNAMPYRMLSPDGIEKGREYPLVLFLHGSGERGDDNEKQLAHGASIFSNPVNTDKYPAFVAFPQCGERSWIGKIDDHSFMPGALVPPESETVAIVMNLVNDLVNSYPIDRNRIYIVGLSMGGIAVYDLVCRYPDVFTAAVPICGAVNPERLSEAKDVKFMIFHGGADKEVPPICSREAYKTLNAIGADVDYIEFAGVGHDCWSLAFNHPSLLPWLFSQSKATKYQRPDTNLTNLDE